MILNAYDTLSNGVRIPRLGLGTWMIPEADAPAVVETAIGLGYRHIDTAQAYANEAGVADGIRRSGIAREEIFLTSKVAAELKSYDAAAASIRETLRKTGLDYIDLMLIHAPRPWAEFRSEKRYFAENREVWRALEDAYDAGLLRAIGVSNFLADDLDNLFGACRVRPMVNQILTHITNTPEALIDTCRRAGIVTEAYSPIAHGKALENPVIARFAAAYGVTPAQLCIRYTLELGMVSLPKASSAAHIKENAAVDFTILPSDMETLRSLDKIKDYGELSAFPVFGGQ